MIDMDTVGKTTYGIVERLEKQLISAYEKRVQAGETYVDKDGVSRCKKCNDAFFAFIPAIGREVPFACSCERNKMEESKKKEELEKSKRDVINMRRESPYFDPVAEEEYNRWTFDADDSPKSQASMICRSYAKSWRRVSKEGYGLILMGNTGTGKSYYASCIANVLLKNGISSIMMTSSRLINVTRSQVNPQEALDKLNRFQLVVLDDLGAERNTSYAIEQLESFIDSRSLSKKPLIVTTNLTAKEMKETADLSYRRIFDRVAKMCPRVVVVAGESRRQSGRADDVERMRQMMGI